MLIVKQILLALFAAAILLGCNAEDSNLNDGYQVGDLTREAIRLQDKWCNQKDPIAKIVLTRALRESGITIEGADLCTVDIVELLSGD